MGRCMRVRTRDEMLVDVGGGQCARGVVWRDAACVGVFGVLLSSQLLGAGFG